MNNEEFCFLQNQLTDLKNRITRSEIISKSCPCAQPDLTTHENEGCVNSQEVYLSVQRQ